MDRNPPYFGINWTSGIESASRVVSILVFLTGANGNWNRETESNLRALLGAHAYALNRYPSLYSSANNHRIAELAALLLIGVCAPGLEHAVPKPDALLSELEIQIERQFHSDGVGAEQSPTYAAYSLEWLVLAAMAAEWAGLRVSDNYRARTWAAAEHLMWLMDDTGRVPRIGDDDEGRVLALRLAPEPRYSASVASLAARWLGRTGPLENTRDPDLRDLVGAPAPRPGATPPVGDHTFSEGGYTVVRQPTPQGTAVLVLDHGPLGFLSIAAHGHADALSVTLSWGNEPIIVDPGTYLYHSGGAWRDRFRGTAAHNTVCLGDVDQSRIVGPFAWADHARSKLIERSPDTVTAHHDGYLGRFGVQHERRLSWAGDGSFTVEDRLSGRPARPLTWTSGFNLAPGCGVSLDGPTARVETPGGRRLTLRVLEGEWAVVETPYSPSFNHRLTTKRLQLSGALAADMAVDERLLKVQVCLHFESSIVSSGA
jgi:hypothetical protein